MFEGKIFPADPAGDAADGGSTGEGLRPLEWHELTARLAVAREFRRLAAGHGHGGAGSFNPASARHLAALGDGQPGINPIALSDRRMTNCMDLATDTVVSDDRGRA